MAQPDRGWKLDFNDMPFYTSIVGSPSLRAKNSNCKLGSWVRINSNINVLYREQGCNLKLQSDYTGPKDELVAGRIEESG